MGRHTRNILFSPTNSMLLCIMILSTAYAAQDDPPTEIQVTGCGTEAANGLYKLQKTLKGSLYLAGWPWYAKDDGHFIAYAYMYAYSCCWWDLGNPNGRVLYRTGDSDQIRRSVDS